MKVAQLRKWSPIWSHWGQPEAPQQSGEKHLKRIFSFKLESGKKNRASPNPFFNRNYISSQSIKTLAAIICRRTNGWKSRNRLNLPLSIVPSCSDSNSGAFFHGFTLSWPFSPVHPLCFWLILSQTHSNAFSSLVYALYTMLSLCLKVLFILSCSLRIFNAMCSISYSSLILQVCSLTKYFALSSDLSLFLVLFHSCLFFLSFF